MRALAVFIEIVLANASAPAGTEIRRGGLDHMLINDVRVERELKLIDAQCDAVYDLRWRTSALLRVPGTPYLTAWANSGKSRKGAEVITYSLAPRNRG